MEHLVHKSNQFIPINSSNISEPVLDVVQMIKEAKDKAGLGATDSSSRTSSPERDQPLVEPKVYINNPGATIRQIYHS